MQITATLDGSTATIAFDENGKKWTTTITDAANLATDLAAAIDVENVTSTVKGMPEQIGSATTHVGENGAAYVRSSPFFGPHDSFTATPPRLKPRGPEYDVRSTGYRLEWSSDPDGVQIITPPSSRNAIEGRCFIASDQIAAVIAGLNA